MSSCKVALVVGTSDNGKGAKKALYQLYLGENGALSIGRVSGKPTANKLKDGDSQYLYTKSKINKLLSAVEDIPAAAARCESAQMAEAQQVGKINWKLDEKGLVWTFQFDEKADLFTYAVDRQELADAIRALAEYTGETDLTNLAQQIMPYEKAMKVKAKKTVENAW